MSIVISGTTGIDAGSLPVSNCGNTEVEGNLNLSGTGARITGDFSNAILGNRVAFQSSTTNGITIIGSIPNGTSTTSGFLAYGSSDINNSPTSIVYNDGGATNILSSKQGTGIYTPMLFYTGGSERVRIDTSGNLTLNSGTGALGYGTGAGGQVTQLTSKSTAVTLNKPSGKVITNDQILPSNGIASFVVYNNIVTSNDVIILNLSGGFTNTQQYMCYIDDLDNGWFQISLKNVSASSLTNNIEINFTIIKGVIA